MTSFILNLMNRFGYLGILFLIIIENLFPPIPSEVILTLGGFMTTYTSMSVIGVIIFSTLGSVLGAIILYYIGRFLNGERLMHIVFGRIGKILHLNAFNIYKSINWFNEKGSKTVFYCRFVPILRSLISIPAGMSEMNQLKFFIYTTTGSFIWNAILIYLGSVVGESWYIISSIMKQYSSITRLVLLILLLFYLVFRCKKKKTK